MLSVQDYHRAACAKLPKGVLYYYEGGALDEITLRENTAGWARLKLYYRVLTGVGQRDLNTTVRGQSVAVPLLIVSLIAINHLFPKEEAALPE